MPRTYDMSRLRWIAVGCAVLALAANPRGLQSQESRPAWDFLPEGLLYESYVAGEKESRLGAALLFETAGPTFVDGALGGRLGILRYGTDVLDSGQGWQLDVDGAAFPRVNLDNRHVESTDYHFGVPLTFRRGPVAAKVAYSHISSHVGDEYLKANPGFVRINYVRDAFVSGITYLARPELLVYGEVAHAFYVSGGAEPWELQLGAQYDPAAAGCSCGAPFLAVNAHLREEVDFGGSLNAIAGWEWVATGSARRLRAGVQYYRGKSSQYSFFPDHEELYGLVIRFDH